MWQLELHKKIPAVVSPMWFVKLCQVFPPFAFQPQIIMASNATFTTLSWSAATCRKFWTCTSSYLLLLNSHPPTHGPSLYLSTLIRYLPEYITSHLPEFISTCHCPAELNNWSMSLCILWLPCLRSKTPWSLTAKTAKLCCRLYKKLQLKVVA